MRPIFIFGCDRSGTTFLGSLLGSHSRCVATPESQFVYTNYRAGHVATRFDLETAVSEIRRDFRFKLWNLDLQVEEARASGVDSYAKLITFVTKTYAQAVRRAEADVWIDHTPNSCEHSAYLAQLFPSAKFIHIVRDGRAVMASFKGLPWRYHGAGRICRLWVGKVGQGLAAESYLGPSRCVRIRYEDLVADPAGVLRDLAPFLELAYEPQMVTGQGFGPPILTAQHHALVGKPADPGRISAWEKKLPSREVEIFEGMSGDMLACLGYPLKFGAHAHGQTRWERYRERLLDVFYYRRLDGLKERRHRRRTLLHLREVGYLNRQPVLATFPQRSAPSLTRAPEPRASHLRPARGSGNRPTPVRVGTTQPTTARE